MKAAEGLPAKLGGLGKFLKQIPELFLHDLEVLTKDLRLSASENPRVPQVPILGPGNPRTPTAPGDQNRLGSGIFLKAFSGLFLRDLRVLTREFVPFLLRVGMQPLLFLFVFTFILPRMGGGNPLAAGGSAAGPPVDFGTILLPGLMAVAIMFSGIAAVALPLSSEFGITREIDDRVMCPLPLWAVALEKVCFSAMQSIVAALLVIPMAYYVPAVPVRADVHNWFLFVLVLAAGQPAGRIARPGHRLDGQSQADRPGLLHHRCADHFPGMCLLSLGVARQDSLGEVRRPLQSHRLYERRAARRSHAQHRPHALVGDSRGAGLFHRRAGPLGAQGISGQSAVVDCLVAAEPRLSERIQIRQQLNSGVRQNRQQASV